MAYKSMGISSYFCCSVPLLWQHWGELRSTYEATTDLNVRYEPDKDAIIIVTLKQGDVITATGEKASDDSGSVWLKVEVYGGGVVGWVNSYYLQSAASRSPTKHQLRHQTFVIACDPKARRFGFGQSETPVLATEDAIKNCVVRGEEILSCKVVQVITHAKCGAVAISANGTCEVGCR